MHNWCRHKINAFWQQKKWFSSFLVGTFLFSTFLLSIFLPFETFDIFHCQYWNQEKRELGSPSPNQIFRNRFFRKIIFLKLENPRCRKRYHIFYSLKQILKNHWEHRALPGVSAWSPEPSIFKIINEVVCFLRKL